MLNVFSKFMLELKSNSKKIITYQLDRGGEFQPLNQYLKNHVISIPQPTPLNKMGQPEEGINI